MVALDDRRLEAELRGADRRHVAAGSRADDDDVEGLLGHGGSSRVWRGRRKSSRPRRKRRGPAIQAILRAAAQSASRLSRRRHVAARAQVLVEQLVVAVDVGHLRRGQLLALASPPRPCIACRARSSRSSSCRIVPQDCPAASGLAPGSPPQSSPAHADSDAAIAATARNFQDLEIVLATKPSCIPPTRARRYETQRRNDFNRLRQQCDNFAARKARCKLWRRGAKSLCSRHAAAAEVRWRTHQVGTGRKTGRALHVRR